MAGYSFPIGAPLNPPTRTELRRLAPVGDTAPAQIHDQEAHMHRTYLAALGAVVLAVAGCGDDKKSSSAKPTKADYIAKADAICAAGKTQARPYKKQLDSLPADAQIKDTVPAVQGELKVSRDSTAKLRALAAPSEDKATLARYLALLDKALVAGNQLIAAARTNDIAKVKQVGAANPALRSERKQVAKQYGFKHCA